ncbi:MAG: hypothetical protein J6E40_12030 [Lachnospiraceae bacterium]|nr:hypothetical protein [Lachnospiraceae bacterium]
MIIGVTGYGGSGASACIALIKEFDNVQFYRDSTEFQILQQPDGITDLRYNLVESRRRISINTAIIRFKKMISNKRSDRLSSQTHNQFKKISLEYISSLARITWIGKSTYDPQDLLGLLDGPLFKYPNALIRRLIWLFKSEREWPPSNRRYYTSLSETDFVNYTKKYLNNIFKASGFDTNRPILLEQLFSLENPTGGFDYFDDNVRSIIIDRDPRDFYTLVSLYWSKSSTGYMPNNNNVKDFVEYYKGLHHYISSDSRVLYLRFEDLIYQYDETVRQLETYLGIRHVSKGTFFKPELSINNTKIYQLHPELADDIAYIENNLNDYLYDFEKYEDSLGFHKGITGVFDDKPNDLDSLKKRKRIKN